MISTPPRHSIVIPCHGFPELLREALQSVAAQGFEDWEAIVVDDGSPEPAESALHDLRDPRLRFVRQERGGPTHARRRGLELARAPVVTFLDADDRLRPGALSRLALALERRPEASVAYGSVVPVDRVGRPLGFRGRQLFAHRPSGDVLESILAHNFISAPGAACARTDAVRAVAPFPGQFDRGQDWLMWCFLATAGRFAFVGGPPVLEYRQHAGSITATLGATPAWSTIDLVFSDARVRARLSATTLARLRRRRAASATKNAALWHVRRGSWSEAGRLLAESCRQASPGPRDALHLLLAVAARTWRALR